MATSIARELVDYAGRIDSNADSREQYSRQHDDWQATAETVAAVMGDAEPDWRLRLGESDKLLLAFGDFAAVAHSPEPGTLEVDYLGTLAGGEYQERRNEHDDWLITFKHPRLEAPVTISGRAGGVAPQRETFRRWAGFS